VQRFFAFNEIKETKILGEKPDKRKLHGIMRVIVGWKVAEWFNSLLDQTSDRYPFTGRANTWLFNGGISTHSIQELLKHEAKA
jgi:hypothetical protein